MQHKVRFLIVGGGFFGCRLALQLAELHAGEVMLVEAGAKLMQRASYNNQARVHNGYHYPRSLITALRSRLSFPKFLAEYPQVVKHDMTKYYGVAKPLGKVTFNQFKNFFDLVGAPMKPAPAKVLNWFNQDLIEGVLEVQELAFDANILKNLIEERMDSIGFKPTMNTRALKLKNTDAGIEVTLRSGDETYTVVADYVFNVTYANLNYLAAESGLKPTPIKIELAEMALVDVPEELKQVGITIMCGPFWSLMPFPDRKLHTFSHVRYTPHFSWKDNSGFKSYDPYVNRTYQDSQYLHMLKDAQRFMPMLSELQYKDSLWELKAVLLASEENDSRPILLQEHPELKHFYNILGGKIDNVYDMESLISTILSNQPELQSAKPI